MACRVRALAQWGPLLSACLTQPTFPQLTRPPAATLAQEHVLAAALRLHDPKKLARIRQRTAMPVTDAPPQPGDFVKITKGDYEGQFGQCFEVKLPGYASPRFAPPIAVGEVGSLGDAAAAAFSSVGRLPAPSLLPPPAPPPSTASPEDDTPATAQEAATSIVAHSAVNAAASSPSVMDAARMLTRYAVRHADATAIAASTLLGFASPRYAVRFSNQTVDAGLPADFIVSSGMSEPACRAWSREQRAPALAAVAARLPGEVQAAVHAVVEGDESIVELLRADPPHALQEYLAAREICEGVRLWDSPPWLWTSWWENTLDLGVEIGTPFRRGLLRAAGVRGSYLNLRGKIGGDRKVSLKAVGQLLQVRRALGEKDPFVLPLASLARSRLLRHAPARSPARAGGHLGRPLAERSGHRGRRLPRTRRRAEQHPEHA